MLKSKEFNPEKFYKKGLKRDKRSANGRKFCNINESNMGPSFGCQSATHVVKDCLILKKKAGK